MRVRFSEPGTKVSGFLSGAGIYLGANILNAMIPFALLPILTRFLSPAEYGQVAMYQVLLSAFAGIIGLSVHGAVSVKYYDADVTQPQLGEFMGSCLQILVLTTCLALVVVVPFRAHLGGWLGLDPAWVVWAVIVSAASFVVQIRLGQWQVRKRPISFGLFRIGSSLANALLSILLVVVLLQGAAGRIDGQNIMLMASGLLAYLLLKKDHLVRWAWRPDYIREALRFGVPLIPHVLGLVLLATVDRVMINSKLGLQHVGTYMVAVQLTSVMPIVFSAINTAYVPWLFERLKRDDEKEKCEIVKNTYLYFAAVLALALAAFPVGHWFVPIIAGDKYAGAGSAVGWLALGQAFFGMYLMVTNFIFFSKRTGLLSFVTISSGFLNIALLMLLIEWCGIEGAAMAFAIAMAIRFCLTWLVAQKRHPMPWTRFQIKKAA